MADQGRGRGRGGGGGGFRGGRGGFGGDRGGGGFRGGRGGGGYDGPSDRSGDRGGGRGGGRGGFDRGSGGFRGAPRGGGFQGGRGEPPKVFGNGNPSQPDPNVTKLEDAMVKGEMVSMMAATSIEEKEIPLPRRPGYGIKGTPIVLYTNYFELKGISPQTSFYRYSVGFQPDNDTLPKPKKKRLIQLLLKMAPFAGTPIASDLAQNLVTTKKLDLEKDRFSTKLEWFPADGGPLPTESLNEHARVKAARKRNTFTILVQEIGTVELDALHRDLAQPSTTYPLKLEAIQALNIIMGHEPSSDTAIAVAGGNKFYPFGNHPQVQMADLGGALKALRGYFSSVRTSVSRLLVNVNVATGAFYKPGPLLPLMQEFGRPGSEFEHRRLAAFFRKLRFETNYILALDESGKEKRDANGRPITKRKVHTISDLSKFGQNAQTVKFQELDKNGTARQVTVADYFKRKYSITLSAPTAPLVNYGLTKDPKWIPAELCTILDGQVAKRLLLGPQTSEMIKFAARRPHENAESITGDGLKVTRIQPVVQGLNTALSRFGIKIDPNLLTVPGRILAAPQLVYRQKTHNPFNGAWNLDPRQLGQQPFRRIKSQLKEWSTLVIHLGNRETIFGGRQAIMHHLNQFRATLETYGLGPGPVQPPIEVNIAPSDLQNKNVENIQAQVFGALKQQGKPKFLFILLPNDNAVMYDSLKHLFDCQHGIPNICNVGSKFSKEKGQMQYFANVAMKFNQKLGGVNHTVDLKTMAPLDAQTIVFGIDVTHPSPGSSETAPSIAGVVASVDAEFSQFPASMRTQKGRQEMVAALDEMIVERLKLWSKRNKGGLPNKVIVYRDGVSEGQYQIVLREEYPAFEKAFNTVYGNTKKHPKISIIMVGKRHHTRFYPTKMDDTDGKTGNCKPGTVVDRGVTGEKLFDFFLLAHQGLQGTAKPAHYVVLKDDNKLGADQLQSLTHSLCYTFARATRSVSICPPAYYADLLCERGRSYLQGVLKGDGAVEFSTRSWQRDVHQNLMETMYYL